MKAYRSKKRRLFLIANKFVAIIVLLFFSTQTALANPYGAQVASGNVGINTQGNTLTVTNSPNSIINWQGFSIASNEAVRFIQQSSQSAVLNRIIGQNPSAILGALQSNGRVFLINPNGILFGQGAQINVNGLVASTLNLTNQDFLAGRYNFTDGALAGTIKNQGTISTPAGGKVYLIAPEIENSGIINSPQGDIILAAGHSVQLVDSFNPDISVVVSAPENKAVNLGQIMAASGKIGIYGGLIQQKGLVSADRAVVGENGKIYFKATKDINLAAGSTTSAQGGGEIKILGGMDNGTVTVNGALDASAPGGGDGGFIETSASQVFVGDTAAITTLAPYGKTGTWLIDPTNYAIAADGNITGAALSAQLNSGNVTIATSSAGMQAGDITVSDSVTWTTGNTLTLQAHNDINLNQSLTADLGGKLILRSDSDADGAGNVIFGGSGHVTMAAGQGSYATIYYNPPGGYTAQTNYSGYFTIVTPTAYMLVNNVTNLQAMNTNLAGVYALGKDIDASATSGWNAGKGFLPIGDTGAPAFSGIFDGNGYVITGLTINRPSGTNYVGLFGYNSGIIRNVGLINGSITGYNDVGGLAGWNNTNSSISNSFYTGTLTGGSTEVGGLVGCNKGSISNSYTAGTVTNSSDYVGGLVGNNYVGGTIINSYSTAAVSGNYAGGLVGCNIAAGISNSYSTGAVSGTNLGGLIGLYSSGAITSSYWDTETSGRAISGGGTGKTTAEMMTPATYTGWDFANTWWMSDTNTRPFLRSEYRTTINNAHQLQLMGMNATTLGAGYKLAADITMSELAQASGMWNTTAGFVPVGSDTDHPFTGAFDGLGHTITGLKINRPGINNIGLFGFTSGAAIQNIGLVTANITGQNYVGGLVGWHNGGTISTSYSSGTVTGTGNSVGGLVGENEGDIEYSYSSGTVTGNSNVGGLAGVNSAGTGAGISNSYSTVTVSGNSSVGGMVGTNGVGCTISNSFSTGAVNGGVNSDYTGGLAGYNAGLVSGSYATGAITGEDGAEYVGGLVGLNFRNGVIRNSYATGQVSGGLSFTGGLVGYNIDTTVIEFSYATGAVSGGGQVGGLIGFSSGGAVSNSYWDTATSGLGTSGGGAGAMGKTTAEMMTQATYTDWDFTNTWWMSNTRPFLRWEYSTTITNARQLQLMAMNPGASYTLANNIDLGPELAAVNGKYPGMWGAAGFAPIGNSATKFTGAFDGLGNTITGLFINRPTTDYIGLFGYTNNATIQNVELVTVNINGGSNVGGLVGQQAATGGGSSTIANSSSSGIVTGTSEVGGLIGRAHATGGGTVTITDSSSSADVTGLFRTGGLVGVQYAASGGGSTIANSNSTGAVTGIGGGDGEGDGWDAGIGGLAGFQEAFGGTAVITNSYHSTDLVTNSGDGSVGGLVGLQNTTTNTATITNSYNTAAVTGTNYVGGLVGHANGIISNSYNTGQVTGSGDNVGGLVGYNLGGSIGISYNTGAVSGNSAVGGLVGYSDFYSVQVGDSEVENHYGAIADSYNTGAVSGGGNNVGGLVGYNLGSIDSSYNTGAVSGAWVVGGLTGFNNTDGSISNSYNTGSVIGTGDFVGGLVGANYISGSIGSSYSTGAVSGTNQVGGLTGYNQGSIDGSYSTGAVSGELQVGGLAGGNTETGSITDSYWDRQTSGQIHSAGSEDSYGKTTAEMKQQATFTGWDFANIWQINEGASYPSLRDQAFVNNVNTWTGTEDSQYWFTDGNWSLGHVPLATEQVNIPDLPGTSFIKLLNDTQLVKQLTSYELFIFTGGGALTLTNSGVFYAGLSLAAGTTLTANDTLNAEGTVSLLGGTMSLNGSGNTIANLNMTGGTLNGTGNVSVTNSFSRTGGTIAATLTGLSITQAAGNLAPGVLNVNGAVSLIGNAGTLTLDSISAAEIYGRGGSGIAVNGAINTAGILTLVSTGPITQTAAITANTLNLTNTSATSDLSTQTNYITHLGTINAAGQSFLIHNAGALDQTGVITAGTFAAKLDAGALTLPIQANAIANLGFISAPGGFFLQETGGLTTGTAPIQSSGGSVSITAHSPLTIGSGGVSADGNISLEAAPSGGSDGLTINGSIASSNGNLILTAGSSIVLGPGAALSAPHGTITQAQQLNGTPAPAADSTVTGNTNATNNTSVAFESAMETIATVTTISEPDKKEDEEQKKKKEGGERGADEKKLDNKDKKYCN